MDDHFQMPPWLSGKLFEFGGAPITLTRLAVALAIVVIILLVARFARLGVERLIRRRGKQAEGVAYAVGRIVQYVLVITGLVVAIHNLGVDMTGVAALGALLSLGIGFGLQNIVQNFVSGFILLLERPVQKGDFVVIGNTVGTVQEISLRATRVISRDGVSIIVPNSELISGPVVNQSAPTGTLRVRIAVGVAYGSDMEAVHETLLEVARSHPAVLTDPPPRVFFRNFGDSALELELAVWVGDPRPVPAVESDLRFAIDRSFRTLNVTIAFPQLDVHVHRDQLHRDGPSPQSKARNTKPIIADTSRQEATDLARVVRDKDVARKLLET